MKTLLIWLAIMLQCLPCYAGGVLMMGGGVAVSASPSILRPDGAIPTPNATAITGCTDLWECIDEAVADDETSYIRISSGTLKYAVFTSISTVPEGVTIDSVRVFARIRAAATSDDININLGSAYRTTWAHATTGWIDGDSYTINSTWTTNPADSQPFEKADIDNLQFGVGAKNVHTGDIDITQLWAEVHYH